MAAAAVHNTAVASGDIHLNAKTAITQAELAEIMAPNAKWPVAGSQDPWVLVHNSIRMDMKDLAAALATVAAGVKNGAALEKWQVSYLKAYVPMMYTYIHHHHDVEEDIFFPFMLTRTEIGERLSADHVKLMEVMDRLRDATAALAVTGKADTDSAAIEAVKGALEELMPLMEEHFQEEESKGLPLLRMHFSAKELKPVDKKIQKTLTPQDMAHFLSPMKSTDEKRKIMTMLGVPGIIQSLIMLPACKKFDKEYQSKLRELQAGKRAPPSGCFAA